MAREEAEHKWMRMIGTLHVIDYTEGAYNGNKEKLEILPDDFDVVAHEEHVTGLQKKTRRDTKYCDRYFKRILEAEDGEKRIKIGEVDRALEKLDGITGTFEDSNKTRIVIKNGVIIDVEKFVNIDINIDIEPTPIEDAKIKINKMDMNKENKEGEVNI